MTDYSEQNKLRHVQKNQQSRENFQSKNSQDQRFTLKWRNYPLISINNDTNAVHQDNNFHTQQILQSLSEEKSISHSQDSSSNISQQFNEPAQFNNQLQTNPESIKLNIRSQLIRRTRKYQISTNNAHKKYINCLKNLFYQALSQTQIQQFQEKYLKLKNNRVFFFIILVYIKYRFSPQLRQAVRQGFYIQMNQKIQQYENQIRKCNDAMLKNYRFEEIREIQISLKAIDQFYLNNTPLAVQYLYRKEKHIIVKQNHFRASLKLIQDLEKQFSLIQAPKITQPYLKNHYHRKIAHYALDRQKQIGEVKTFKGSAFSQIKPSEQDRSESQQIQQNAQSQSKKNNEKISSKNDEQQEDSIQQEVSESSQLDEEDEKQSESFSSKSNEHQEINFHYMPENQETQKHSMEDIIFPPIPPYFYLPKFDQKYGHLFRRLAYVKSWRQLNQRIQPQDYNLYNNSFSKKNQSIPTPLLFRPQNSLFNRKY